MNKAWLIAGLAVAAVAYLGRNQVKSFMIGQQDALQDANVNAFLALLRGPFEGGGRYDLLYHTPHSDPLYDPANPLTFSDFSTHPNVHIPFTDPRTGKPNYSTAAGAYQILYRTWKGLTMVPGAPQDFSPASQDWFAVALLKGCGALAPLMAGDVETAIRLASPVWASLPYSTSKQANHSYAQAVALYRQYGGTVA